MKVAGGPVIEITSNYEVNGKEERIRKRHEKEQPSNRNVNPARRAESLGNVEVIKQSGQCVCGPSNPWRCD